MTAPAVAGSYVCTVYTSQDLGRTWEDLGETCARISEVCLSGDVQTCLWPIGETDLSDDVWSPLRDVQISTLSQARLFRRCAPGFGPDSIERGSLELSQNETDEHSDGFTVEYMNEMGSPVNHCEGDDRKGDRSWSSRAGRLAHWSQIGDVNAIQPGFEGSRWPLGPSGTGACAHGLGGERVGR